MPWGRITKHVSRRTTSVTTVTTHVAQPPEAQPVVSFTSSHGNNNNTTTHTPLQHPPLVCAPGMLQYNATLCMPCPPGWKCLYGIPTPCAADSWSAWGLSTCIPCTNCPNGTRILVPCGGPNEGLCHPCPRGFALDASTDTCMPPSSSGVVGGGVGGAAQQQPPGYSSMLDPVMAAVVLILLVLELACILCCRRWYSTPYSHTSAYGRVDEDELATDDTGAPRARGGRVPSSSKRWAWLPMRMSLPPYSAERGQGRGTGFEPFHTSSTGRSGRQESSKELLRACAWFDPRNRTSSPGGGGHNQTEAHHHHHHNHAVDEATVRLINPHKGGGGGGGSNNNNNTGSTPTSSDLP